MNGYHYGITIREFREKKGLTYDPFHPDAPLRKESSMYDETLNAAESLIKRTWRLRRIIALPSVSESVNELDRLFTYLREHMPPPLRLETRFQVLYAQDLRLKAVMDIEFQRYREALDTYRQMHEIAATIDHPATLALALMV